MDFDLLGESLHQDVLIIHLENFRRRELQLALHAFHSLEGDDAVAAPHLVLNQTDLIGHIEQDENVFIEKWGIFEVVFPEPVFKVRRISDHGHVFHGFGVMVYGGEEDLPYLFFVLEVIDGAETLFADLVAGDDEGIGVFVLKLFGPSALPGSGNGG